jgi:hypothetical protein
MDLSAIHFWDAHWHSGVDSQAKNKIGYSTFQNALAARAGEFGK